MLIVKRNFTISRVEWKIGQVYEGKESAHLLEKGLIQQVVEPKPAEEALGPVSVEEVKPVEVMEEKPKKKKKKE